MVGWVGGRGEEEGPHLHFGQPHSAAALASWCVPLSVCEAAFATAESSWDFAHS